MQTVSEIMTRNVQSVSPHETLRRAAQLMDDLNVGALPVCDGDRLVGMVTDRDITVRATSIGMAPDDAVVDEVMSTDVRWCFEDQSVDEVMQQMADTQIRRVPVVSHDDARTLIGIVSLGDIATKSGDTSAQSLDVGQTIEKVSFPSEPDLSTAGATTGAKAGGAGPGASGAEARMADANVPDEKMSTIAEASSTADPSDVVEVTPADLVNKNAPGSTSLSPERLGGGMVLGPGDEVVVIRRTSSGEHAAADGNTATAGIDAAGATGA